MALLTSGSQVRVLLGSPLFAKNKCNFGEQRDRWLLIFPLMFLQRAFRSLSY